MAPSAKSRLKATATWQKVKTDLKQQLKSAVKDAQSKRTNEQSTNTCSQ